MVADDLRMPVVTKVVLGQSLVSVHGFKIRNQKFGHVCPITPGSRFRRKVIVQRAMVLEGGGRGHISMNAVIKRWNIGGPLDGSVAPERQHTAAGPSYIA